MNVPQFFVPPVESMSQVSVASQNPAEAGGSASHWREKRQTISLSTASRESLTFLYNYWQLILNSSKKNCSVNDSIVIIMGLVLIKVQVKLIHAKIFSFKASPRLRLPAATQLDYWDFTSEFAQISVEKVPSEMNVYPIIP